MRGPLNLAAGLLAALCWLAGIWAAPLRAEGFTQGLLFEIATDGVAPSYLFATIHSDDPRATQLPPPVRAAFDGAQGFAMEAIPDDEALRKSIVLMTYSDGRSLRQVLPPDLYAATVQVMASRGMSEEAIRDFKPWALVTLLSTPPSAGGELLDLRLYRAALAQGKPTVGLETLEEQVALLDGLSETDQVTLLRQTLATYPELKEVFLRLLAAYVRRDLSSLAHLSQIYARWGSPELAERFREVVVEDRNRRMAERMRPLLAAGGRFIAVGALHLAGPEGVLQLLSDQGYRVRLVY